MQRILMICGEFLEGKDANSICAQIIARELQDRGHEVNILYSSALNPDCNQLWNSSKCYRVRLPRYKELIKKCADKTRYRFFTRLLLIARKPFAAALYPNVAFLSSRRYLCEAKRIIEKRKPDMVLVLYKPYEPLYTALKLKKECGNAIRIVAYHLDYLTDSDEKHSLFAKYKRFRGERVFRKELELLDRVFVQSTAQGRFSDTTENKKIGFVDFPLYLKSTPTVQSKFVFPPDSINISYIGSLDKENRNPKVLFRIIESMEKIHGKTVRLHLWGNIDQEIKDGIRGDQIVYHGYIDNCFVADLYRRSDFLLNVGNAITCSWIPSKIFQLFSAHKPIIDCITNEADATIPYFQKYEYALLLKLNEDVSAQYKDLKDFICSFYGIELTIDDTQFETSTPTYVVDQILKH